MPLTRRNARAFWRWLRADLKLFRLVKGVRDGRDPYRTIIPLDVMLAAVLAMFWFQLPSVEALDDQLRHGRWLRRALAGLGYDGPISNDAIRNAAAKLDLESLRAVLHHLGRRMLKGWGAGRYLESQLGKRLRRINQHHLAAKAVVALDGHYLFGTYSEKRCCPQCQKRSVTVNGQKITEYYHMTIVAQMVGAHPAVILDFEPLLPGENELTAVKRLLPRLAEVYGDSIGIVIADAMYDTEPFRRQVFELGYRSVVVHKTDNHDPARTAERNLAARDPKRCKPDARHRPDPKTEYRVWDEPAGGRRLIEVRRSCNGTEWKSQGMTDLPREHGHPLAIGILIEERWDIENTGFKQLVTDWRLDRAYIHAKKPTAVWACVNLALLAYNAFHYFVYRILKLDPDDPERTLQAFRRDLIHTVGTLGLRAMPDARPP